MQLGGYCIAFLGVLSYNNIKNLSQAAPKTVPETLSGKPEEGSALLAGKIGAERT